MHIHSLAFTISTNSGFSEAPPTRNPSTSGWLARALQLPALTEPESMWGDRTVSTELVYLHDAYEAHECDARRVRWRGRVERRGGRKGGGEGEEGRSG